MLNYFDTILAVLFDLGVVLVATIWAIAFASLALLNLFSDEPILAKTEMLGMSGCYVGTCYWFWAWRDQIAAAGTLEVHSDAPSSMVLLLLTVLLVVLAFLRDHFIAYCITGGLCLGTILLGF